MFTRLRDGIHILPVREIGKIKGVYRGERKEVRATSRIKITAFLNRIQTLSKPASTYDVYDSMAEN
jgi:hypothetical protein